MAIIGINGPLNNILPVRNRQEIEVTTDAHITTPGEYAITDATLNTQPVNNETLIFTWGTNVVTLTFKTVVTAATHILIQGTIPLQLNEIVTVMQKQYKLYNAYHISNTATNLILTARSYGPAYDVSITGTAAARFGAYSPTPGVTEVPVSGFKIQFDLYEERTPGSDVFDLLVPESFVPNTTGIVVYDPAELMKGRLNYTLPTYNQTTPSVAPAPIKNFKIGYGEYYTGEVQNYAFMNFTGLLAGLTEASIPGNTFYDDHFTDTLTQKFLTTIPRGDISSPKASQHYLYYYQRAALAVGYVTIYIQYYDGTPDTVVEQLHTLASPGTIIIIPAGYNQNDIDTHKIAGKAVKRWGIQIGGNGINHQDYTDFTEIFWYSLDDKAYTQNRYLLFGNSCGGMDTVWLNGESAYKYKIEAENYNVFTPTSSEAIIHPSLKKTDGTRTALVDFNTGYKPRTYLSYLHELLMATTVYEIVNGQFVAVRLDVKDTVELYNDADGKWQLQGTYTIAMEETI